MKNPKLLTDTDLRLSFKRETGNYPTYGSELDIESTITESNYPTIKYVKHLEEQLLEYKNAELVTEQANIEANTVVREERMVVDE